MGVMHAAQKSFRQRKQVCTDMVLGWFAHTRRSFCVPPSPLGGARGGGGGGGARAGTGGVRGFGVGIMSKASSTRAVVDSNPVVIFAQSGQPVSTTGSGGGASGARFFFFGGGAGSSGSSGSAAPP